MLLRKFSRAFLPPPLFTPSRARVSISRFSMTASTPQIATHDGTFHCDEALACFMLRTHTASFLDSPILRTRNPEKLATASIVVDVGAVYDPSISRYDHHQRSFNTAFAPMGKRSRTKLSSAGLVYKHYGMEVIRSVVQKHSLNVSEEDLPVVYEKMYDSFVEAIDAIDNGINMYESTKPPKYESSTDLSARVAKLNAEWYETNPDQDANFQKAMKLVGAEFEDAILHIVKSWLPARSIVKEQVAKRFEIDDSGRILLMEKWAPWKDHVYSVEEEEKQKGVDKPILYVVYKDMTGNTWRVQCVPVAKGSFESRKALPEKWRGIRDDELSKLTGISECIFVHASGFIGGNRSYEGALHMAKSSLEMVQ